MSTEELKEVELWCPPELLGKAMFLNDSLKSLVQDKITSHENSSNEVVSDWLKWCESQINRVKVIDHNIPKGILHDKINGCIHDIKVQGKRRCPDDTLYNKHADLRENVARGNTILYLNNLSDGQVSRDCMIFALRKFTGGMGDEDEDQPENNKVWTDYFLKPLESTSQVICTRKANGEAAHLGIRWIKDRFVLCVGSKNVHMLISNRADIEKYSDGRFQVARYIAEAVFDLLDSLPQESLSFLCNFMHYTRFTAVFEVLNPNNQHVEDLSHLKCTELRFISWTNSYEDRKCNSYSYCAMNPKLGIDLARGIGFKTVEYEVIQPTEIDDRMNKIRHDYGYEGEVLYFLDSSDNVIGLLKKKTAWYIVARAIREQAANALNAWNKNGASNYDPVGSEDRMIKRLKAIKVWLDLSDDCIEAWLKIGKGFLKWMIELADKGDKESHEDKDKDLLRNDLELRSKFPRHWKSYLEYSQQTDNIKW